MKTHFLWTSFYRSVNGFGLIDLRWYRSKKGVLRFVYRRSLSLSLLRSTFSKLFSGYDRQQIGCCHFHMLWIQCKHTHIKSVCIGNGICMTRVFCASNWNEEFDLMEMQKNVANLFAICFRTLTCCIRLKAEKKFIQLE